MGTWFLSEVQRHGGILLAPLGNPGFDLVVVLKATKGKKKGIVLLLFETQCSGDAFLANKLASPDDGRSLVEGNPLQLVDQLPHHNQGLTDDGAIDLGAVTSPSKPSDATKAALDVHVTRKAWLTLRGLKESLPHIRRPVIHVCYVYGSTGKYEPRFKSGTTYTLTNSSPDDTQQQSQEISLGEAIKGIEKEGTTVTLHAVAGQTALENFFTAAVYHTIPD